MKRFVLLLISVLVLLCSCENSDSIEGTYTATDDGRSLAIILDDGYCLIDVLDEQDGKVAATAAGGKYTLEKDELTIEILEGMLKGERFSFLYNENRGTLADSGNKTVYEKQKVKNQMPDGVYAYDIGSENCVLTIDGDYCSIFAHSINANGEEATAEEEGTVKVSGNTVELELADKNYKFIYASNANVLMDTVDGRVYKQSITEE